MSESDSVRSGEDCSTSKGGGSTTGSSDVEENMQPAIASKESRDVAASRFLVMVILLIFAGTAGALTYIYKKNEINKDFENNFESVADEIIGVSKDNALSTFGILRSLSDTLTSFANNQNAEWPLITVPDFEHRSSNYLAISGVDLVTFSPLVLPREMPDWVEYSVEKQDWITEGLKFDKRVNATTEPIRDMVWRYSEWTQLALPEQSKRATLPLWQMYPPPEDTSVVNYNLRSNEKFERGIFLSETTKKIVLSEVLQSELKVLNANQDFTIPKSLVIQPVLESFDPQAPVAGFLIVVIPWDIFFNKVLGDGSFPVVCVVSNSCGDVFSYRVDGPQATFLGNHDVHDSKFESLKVLSKFPNFEGAAGTIEEEVISYCEYSVSIYPTEEFHEEFHDGSQYIYMAGVLGVFFLTSMVFVLYDVLVQRLKAKVVTSAERSNAIVNSLFPQEVQDRLYKAADEKRKVAKAPKFLLQNFLNDEEKGADGRKASEDLDDIDALNKPFPGQVYDTKPIADLFPECTIMFADISGFTAWSSVRDPSQVFTLLECIYNSFDVIARRSKVFKVETIGDCYVAVCGLPHIREDHAIVMAKYANKCLQGMGELTRKLEVTLGPDTSELAMRFGLHSGPVTAGVLRGEKSRFQLFGDTVNTAARVEGTGQRNKIHCSEETANKLIAGGKAHWVTKREEMVFAKGKGEMQTYWVKPTKALTEYAPSSSGGSELDPQEERNDAGLLNKGTETVVRKEVDMKTKRMVEWICGVMLPLLKKIVAYQESAKKCRGKKNKMKDQLITPVASLPEGSTVLDEVQEVITLAKFDAEIARNQLPLDQVDIDTDVLDQLHDLIEVLASRYHDNPFHCFEHASHVTMSVAKLLFRIVAPEVDDESNEYESLLHDNTYGITSDPLTQFAVAFAALIHDLDHPGIPNAVLVKEEDPMAVRYHNKSVAEQNSVDLAWDILMREDYKDLRACLCPTENDLMHFRQLVVNSVMATDIVDKDLGALRKARWTKAFSTDVETEGDVNRKATIVIEHIIQASDVAHTMQHWDVYRRWNERFFEECYLGFKNGRTDTDPSIGWYNGEIGFFDFYIIPLAKKLKECGIFGVSSDEYLNYALENRRQWVRRGESVVEDFKLKYANKDSIPEEEVEEDDVINDGNTN